MAHLMTTVPQRRIHELEQALAREVANRVQRSNSIEANSPDEFVVRDLLPAQDLTSGADNGWDGQSAGWRQDWAAGGATADTWNEAYEIDSRGKSDDKVLGIAAIQFASGSAVDREIRFRKGRDGAQGVKAWSNLEGMENDDEGIGVLADAIIYGPTQSGNIEHYISAAEDGHRTRYLGLVGEATGEVISEPHNPLR